MVAIEREEGKGSPMCPERVMAPADIEARSMEIIEAELKARGVELPM